jgi:hypothetical protein
MLHTCYPDIYGTEPCDDDLVGSIRLHIPFIKWFCTGREKLTIIATTKQKIQSFARLSDPNGPQTCEEALAELLSNDLREIPSLKEPVVLDSSFANEPSIGHAEDAIQWFQKRSKQRAREATEMEWAKRSEGKGKEDEGPCGFYGDGHIWVHCHNLCNFYGHFGHFRKNCPVRKL